MRPSPMLVTILCVLLVRLSVDAGQAAAAQHGAGEPLLAALFALWTLMLLGAVLWLLRPVIMLLRSAPRQPARA